MTEKEKIQELVDLLKFIKENLDHLCCQSLMDADSISQKIEDKLNKIEER
tara:strand:- start:1222 stop:1371 length:150 start_codon:yes stop_codon:yes gene_type:complete